MLMCKNVGVLKQVKYWSMVSICLGRDFTLKKKKKAEGN